MLCLIVKKSPATSSLLASRQKLLPFLKQRETHPAKINCSQLSKLLGDYLLRGVALFKMLDDIENPLSTFNKGRRCRDVTRIKLSQTLNACV